MSSEYKKSTQSRKKASVESATIKGGRNGKNVTSNTVVTVVPGKKASVIDVGKRDFLRVYTNRKIF